MELNKFVSETLKHVLEGIRSAQEAVHDGSINPKIWNSQRGEANKMKILESNAGEWIHMVDFDVALTVIEGTETKGGIGLFVGPVALGSKGQSNAENSSLSRIKFQVPIAYPKNEKNQ